MAEIRFALEGDGIARLMVAVDALAGPRKVAALRRALNHTGDKTFTAVRRELARQMGTTQKGITDNGRGLKKVLATSGDMEYRIVTNGKAMRATEFRYSVSKGGGVTFYPWGKAHHIKTGFFIGSGSKWGTGKKKADGLYYRGGRKGKYNFKAMYGPNLNKELVKDATAKAFAEIVARDLPARVEHEVRVITAGIVS